MTMLTTALSNVTNADLERMTQRAWYRAVRSVQEVRAHCSQHGSGGHTEVCLALGASARSDDRFWHELKTEQARRAAQN